MLASPPMLTFLATEPLLTPLQATVLGAVQGLSELLPISSSAHLYLVPTLLGWPYAGVAFDVAQALLGRADQQVLPARVDGRRVTED
ncbi:MAG: undecaprenyl-diphosphate phosphatase, partial [Candidatus Eisenbacteria bacterium]